MSAWNGEKTDLLKVLWAQGLSASQIAGRLGGVTRNAVIGKIHRLGLSGRATTSRMTNLRPRTIVRPLNTHALSNVDKKPRDAFGGLPSRGVNQPKSWPHTPPVEELVIPFTERKTIQSLTDCTCRWPIGDPQRADFHFCGKDKVQGLPYCAFHARRAFQPQQRKPQAKRSLIAAE